MAETSRNRRGFSAVKDTLITGFALFAMFFGAGNLIFPPSLGRDAGDLWPVALVGFVAMDAVLACVGIYGVNAAGGPQRSIEEALGRRGGIVLNTSAILCLCVLFAMPRTAATTFEISVAPYLGDQAGRWLLPFSLVFFGVVFLLAIRESRIVDIIGRFFTPTLVVGTLILIIAGIVNPLGPIGHPATDQVFQEGVRSGYQTMDVLGVVPFSIILLDSVIAKHYTTQDGKLKALLHASVIASLLLALIYGGLAYLGATAASLDPGASQIELTVALTRDLLGDLGLGILGVVVVLACLTTAVALVSSAAAYFHGLLGSRVSYRVLLVADCAIGVIICNLGLQAIIDSADYVLGVVYPPFLTVVVMLVFHRRIKSRRIYQGAALGACLAALASELFGGAFWAALPLSELGFVWLPFAVLGGFLGWMAGRRESSGALD